MHSLNLIALYTQICECYTKELFCEVQRFSNNSSPQLTDEELLTCYLFGVRYEQKYDIRANYDYIVNHWLSWFPNLPSYQAYNARLNRLAPALKRLCDLWWGSMDLPTDQVEIMLGDSCPIITCSAKRSPKVALELIDKGKCASKSLYYHGVKLHFLGFKREGTLPIPQYLEFTPASVFDLTALKPVLENIAGIPIYLDKAYADENLEKKIEQHEGQLCTPTKKKRGECERIRAFDAAQHKQIGTAVAKVRQPVESFFNWMQEKVHIQNASKVRSTNGLLVHLYGKLAALSLYCLQF
jgi:hypothetical protein